MQKYIWYGNYINNFPPMTLDQANSCSHPGPCDNDVDQLSNGLDLSDIDKEALHKELKEYGAWSHEELIDHVQNLQRLVWIASNDIAENPENYID